MDIPLPVGREGVEPSRCLHRRILSPLRLPIPPPPQKAVYVLSFAPLYPTYGVDKSSKTLQIFMIRCVLSHFLKPDLLTLQVEFQNRFDYIPGFDLVYPSRRREGSGTIYFQIRYLNTPAFDFRILSIGGVF